MIFDCAAVEEKIGYEFKDKLLLRKCFTHSSYANEHNEEDNELLEFFGDSIIEFVVTEYLVSSIKASEGDLTYKRAEMVSKEPLLKIVKKLDIAQYMILGKGQNKMSNQQEKLFSSLYEALVAGIYLDGGIKQAKKFILETLIKDFKFKGAKNNKGKVEKDAKSQLQEYVQKLKIGSISYETLSKSGPEHLPEFRVAVLINGAVVAEGKGKSKKLAETESAKSALKLLKTKQ